MGSRLLGIIVKEFIHLKRDMLALVLALVVPVAMLFIFGWAINTDVKHVRTPPSSINRAARRPELPRSRWGTASISTCCTGVEAIGS
jgi:hypothetical protein